MNKWILRIEGGVVLVFIIYFYQEQQFSWLVFGVFLLVPDLAALGYIINQQVGVMAYNIVHTYSIPAILLLLSIVFSHSVLMLISFIWIAHIGMDRLFGYRLKKVQKG